MQLSLVAVGAMKTSDVPRSGRILRGELEESIAVFGLKVMSLSMGVATTVLLARILGPADFGLYSLVVAAATLGALPAHAGIGTLLVRTTSAGYAQEAWGLVRGLWRWAAQVQAIHCLVIVGVAGGGLWLFASRLSPGELDAATVGIALVPVFALNATRMAMMRGMGDPVAGVMLEALLRPALLLSGLVVFSLLFDLEAMFALGLHLAAGLTAVALGYVLVQRRKRSEVTCATPEYHTAEWWRAVVPLALLVGAERLIKYTDIVLLGALGTTAEVGLYRVAVQGADLIVFGLAGIMLVFGPRLARLHAHGDTAALQRLVTRGSQWSTAAAVCAFFVLAVAGEWLVTMVFGARYSESVEPLMILAAGQLVVAWFGMTLTVLKMTGYERSSATILGVAAAGNIVLNCILIPPLGPTGAALATATTLAFSQIALCRSVRKRLGVRTGALHFFSNRDE